jgi:predicted PhzF superfamily epimerase YddE/YHI9
MSYHIVDTFTPVPFHGNPTAVVLFDKADYNNVTNELKQKLALEFNLSATCFLTPIDTDDFQTGFSYS